MAKKPQKIVIDHVENARLIKELQSEDWKIVRGMEKFLVAFAKASKEPQPMTIQQFAEKHLKDAFPVDYYVELNERRQGYRNDIVNQKDVQRLEAKVEQLKEEQEKLEAQISYYNQAERIELPVPFSKEQYTQKVERLSVIRKELTKFQ